ncbi:MAG: hypothetical protein GY856_17060 [bacterium]|nr:hypothetical protein [bacterium]
MTDTGTTEHTMTDAVSNAWSPPRHAMVLSGGGADGAYEVGALKALLNGKSPSTNFQPLDPAIFAGTSIGSFNSSFMVSQWDEYGAAAVGNLQKVWLDELATLSGHNGAYRFRLNPFDFLDPRNYLEDPLRPLTQAAADGATLTWEAIERTVHLISGKDPFRERVLELFNLSSFVAVEPWERTIKSAIDFKKIRSSSRKLRVAATNWALGELRIFTNGEMTDKLGPDAIRASSAVPGFYPPASVGAQTYVDGAVLENTPLKPAIHAGGDVIHVVYMNTDIRKMPVDVIESTMETLYRSQIISWAAAVNRDIKRAAAYNDGIELLRRSARSEEFDDADLRAFINAAGSIMRRGKGTGKYKPLTIHRYYPPDGLDGALGFLNVDRGRIERLIDEGFHNTVNHNCETNGCILPDKLRSSEEKAA